MVNSRYGVIISTYDRLTVEDISKGFFITELSWRDFSDKNELLTFTATHSEFTAFRNELTDCEIYYVPVGARRDFHTLLNGKGKL